VTFAAAEGILTEGQALTAYTQALEVTLGYVAWPESVDDDDGYAIYRDWGYSYVESLRLGYYYGGLETVTGVDALNGDVRQSTYTSTGSYVYDDTEGLTQQAQIEALAQAGIGFDGGLFEPEAALTQRQAVTLLMQSMGYTSGDWDDDWLGQAAQSRGFLSDGQWQPDLTVTEMDFVRMIIGASRYGDAAALSAAWAAIDGVSEADMGYAAVASALGMIEPETFAPSETCTHEMAAKLLYGFMDRK
jgi:hypothetical protein